MSAALVLPETVRDIFPYHVTSIGCPELAAMFELS